MSATAAGYRTTQRKGIAPMSKKHFEALAETLKAVKPEPSFGFGDDATKQWKRDVEAVADRLASFNTRFNRERFLEACGYYGD